MKLENFPHIIILNRQDLKFKNFDQDLILNLESFEKSLKTWQTKKDAKILEELKAKSKLIAQHIINYYVEEEEEAPAADPVDPPAPEPQPADPVPPADPVQPPVPEKPLSKNEKALKNLFDKGVTEKITVSMLASEGFNTGINSPLGMRGCRVGSYELTRAGTNYYNLKKHE
jgi:hypothetical protein